MGSGRRSTTKRRVDAVPVTSIVNIGVLVAALTILLGALPQAGHAVGGPIDSGETREGNISTAGAADTWTLLASTGDRILLKMGHTLGSGFLDPRLRLYDPTGVLVASDSGANVAEIAWSATTDGTYSVIASDEDTERGPYRLHFARMPGDFATGEQDGGPLTNGATHDATIHTGDLDLWSFAGEVGDRILLKMGHRLGTDFLDPQLRLYDPTGVLLASDIHSNAAEIASSLTVEGTYTVIASDSGGEQGPYRLHFARIPGEFALGEQDGGSLTNGAIHDGTIHTGDLDMWSFAGVAGNRVLLTMGHVLGDGFLDPQLRLYDPTGVLLASDFGANAAEIEWPLTTDGTHIVVASDKGSESGDYTLTLSSSAATSLCGDADGNGIVTVTDGVQTLRAAAGLSSACTAARCDMDGSGTVTVTDGVNVLRKAAGLPVTCESR